MSLVLDASMAIAWLFKDETTEATEAALDEVTDGGATVPAIWRLEVANALLGAMRRARMSRAARNTALDRLADLPIEIDGEAHRHAWAGTLALADRHGLTPYDASYLELAMRLRRPLASLDRPLRVAAQAEGINVMG